MKKTTIASLVATAMVLPNIASGAIVLAGWHAFTVNPSASLSANSAANEGVPGLIDPGSTNISHRETSDSGGSMDGWYGPDSLALGGIQTQQTPANLTGYDPEITEPVGPVPVTSRLNPGYVDTFANGAQPGTVLDGRIAAANGTDVTVTNNSNTTYYLQSFVFDAFLGDVSAVDADAGFAQFTFTVTPLVGAPVSVQVTPSYGVTGYNTDPFANLDTLFGPVGTDIDVPNRIDYGTGTNYVDYVLNLGNLSFQPGSTFNIRFNQIGTGTVRLDNLALFAVPEPSSAVALAGLIASGCFFRRRKNVVA